MDRSCLKYLSPGFVASVRFEHAVCTTGDRSIVQSYNGALVPAVVIILFFSLIDPHGVQCPTFLLLKGFERST